MEGEAVGQEVTDSGIDQSSMEADYMSTYQLVDNDGNNIVHDPLEKETTTPVQDTKPAQPEKQDETATQQTGQDEYLKDFYKEDGSIDVEKAMALFGKKTEQPQQPAAQQQIQQPPQPMPKPELDKQEESNDPHEQMRKNVLAAIELQRFYMQQGDEPQTAMAKAERDINEHLQQYILKSEIQKMRQDFEKEKAALREEVKTEREVAIAEPQAQKNLMSICNKYANGLAAETLQKAIFDVNIGGQFLIDLFGMQNPDKSNLTGEPLQKAMNDWFVRNAAKNKSFVEALAINAINRIQARVYPELAKIIQQNGAARTAQQKRNNPGPKTPQNPTAHKPAPTSGPEHDLAAFFHEVPRDGGGRPHI